MGYIILSFYVDLVWSFAIETILYDQLKPKVPFLSLVVLLSTHFLSSSPFKFFQSSSEPVK